ncbi:MAG: HAMP domain-containing protein, partial [Alphaproteobacteria bacterium]
MKTFWRPNKLLPSVLIKVLPVTVIGLLALGMIANSNVKEIALEEDRNRLDHVATQAATSISLGLQNIVHSAEGLARNDLVINSLIDTSDRQQYIPLLFQSIRIANSEHGRVTLADYRGRLITSNVPGDDYAQAPWLSEVMAGKDFVRVTAAGMIAAIPIYHAGLPEGMIVIEFDSSGLAKVMDISVQADAYSISTINGDTLFISDESFRQSGTGVDVEEAWVNAGAAVEGFPDLRLIVGDRMAAVLAPVERRELYFLAALLLSIAAVTIGIVVTALSVVKPVHQFITGVEKVGSSGDLEHSVEAVGADEFQRLSHSFNAMLSRIQRATTSRDYVDG